jgi:hypothetical protein
MREHIQLGTNDFRRTMLTAAAASNASAFLFALPTETRSCHAE